MINDIMQYQMDIRNLLAKQVMYDVQSYEDSLFKLEMTKSFWERADMCKGNSLRYWQEHFHPWRRTCFLTLLKTAILANIRGAFYSD